jgi:hypothetical protein
LRAEVVVSPELPTQIEDLLERAALEMLSLANKAGRVVTGFAKVEAALAAGGVAALLHAADAGQDGVRKIEAAVRRTGAAPVVISTFAGARLDLALGRANVVHAALLAAPVSDGFLARAALLARYRSEPAPAPAAGLDDAGLPAERDTEAE